MKWKRCLPAVAGEITDTSDRAAIAADRTRRKTALAIDFHSDGERLVAGIDRILANRGPRLAQTADLDLVHR